MIIDDHSYLIEKFFKFVFLEDKGMKNGKILTFCYITQ